MPIEFNPFTGTPNTFNIADPDPCIAVHHRRWRKNRHFIDGEDTVKRCGLEYLPAACPGDGPAVYGPHKDRTAFFPAAAKIQQGISGLIFRKSAQLNTASARVQALTQLISPQGQSLDDLAEEVVRETLITNFTGLLVDHPDASAFSGLSAANADQLGFRPRISMYVAESILEVCYGLVNESRQLVRVRLLENEGTRVRLLQLTNGVYEFQVWDKTATGAFVPGPMVQPKQNGKPLTEIPFVIVSTSDKPTPQPSMLESSVDLNLQHYRTSGLLASALYFLASPVPVVTGVEPTVDPDTGALVPITLDVTPGSVWVFPNDKANAKYLEFTGAGVGAIENRLKDIKDELSTIGHSILAPEKAAPEAAQTQMLRRAAENASLAAFARTMSRKIEKALKLFAQWVDGSTLAYALNTDFMPNLMTAPDLLALLAAWQAGAITHETLLYALRDGEVVSATLDPATEIAATQVEVADRPAPVVAVNTDARPAA